MARIVVHTHGRARDKAYSSLIRTYSERLAGRGVSLIQHPGRLSHDDYLSKLVDAAGEDELILLDENGKATTTEDMVSKWQKIRISSRAVHFAVGPVDGFETHAIRDRDTLSLGPLTMTYEMAAVVLLEQLYRASEIDRGSPYHRE